MNGWRNLLTLQTAASHLSPSALSHTQARYSPIAVSKRKSSRSSKRSTRRLAGASASCIKSSKRNGVGLKSPRLNRWHRLMPQLSKKGRDGNHNNSSSSSSNYSRPKWPSINKINTSNRTCIFNRTSCSTPRTWPSTCRCLPCSQHLHNANPNKSHPAARENRTKSRPLAF
jgi:hypothetical protein